MIWDAFLFWSAVYGWFMAAFWTWGVVMVIRSRRRTRRTARLANNSTNGDSHAST